MPVHIMKQKYMEKKNKTEKPKRKVFNEIGWNFQLFNGVLHFVYAFSTRNVENMVEKVESSGKTPEIFHIFPAMLQFVHK